MMEIKWIKSVMFFFGVSLMMTVTHAQQGRVVVKIKLKEYDSHGKDKNGDKCDYLPGKHKKCDPEFKFCVDKYSGDGDVDHCAYFEEKSGHYNNDDKVDFGGDIKGVDNPIVVTITNYEGIRFKVDVDDDDDGNSDDNMDTFDWRVKYTPHLREGVATHRYVELEGERNSRPSDLELDIWVYCDVNSYGQDCAVYCQGRNSDGAGHYGCNPETGARYCLEGWEGLPDCLVRVDNCEAHACRHNGVCVDQYNAYDCLCEAGYTGDRCESEIDECDSSPCLNNGTCIDLLNEYVCQCDHYYAGADCEGHRCDHPSDYCHNGGTCYEGDNSTLACECPQQYAGIHCDVDACEIIDCVHGECVLGVCECEPNFLGGLCDVKMCEVIPCQSSGSCLNNGTCACQSDRTGAFCETQISPCESDPCLNNSTCVVQPAQYAYQCICDVGYNGTLCEHVIVYPTTTTSPPSAEGDPGQSAARVGSEDKRGSSSGLPEWALGLVISILVLCAIFILLVCAVLYYRRKYKKNAQSRSQLNDIINPMYNHDNEPVVHYTASGGATSGDTTILKKHPDDEDLGPAAPPPYTQYPDAMNGVPLPTYDESQVRGGANDEVGGAIDYVSDSSKVSREDCESNAVDSRVGVSGENDHLSPCAIDDIKIEVNHENPYDTPRNTYMPDNMTNPVYDTPINRISDVTTDRSSTLSGVYDELGPPRDCNPQTSSGHASTKSLYAEVPMPRPVEPSTTPIHGLEPANTGPVAIMLPDATMCASSTDLAHVYDNLSFAPDHTAFENDLNASLEEY